MKTFKQKIFASLVGAVLVFSSLVVLLPKPALAIPVEVTANAPDAAANAISAAKSAMRNSLEFAITQALLTAADTMAQRVAQAAATWVASGGKGQGALVWKQEFGSYGKTLFLDTMSDALNNFSKTALGFNICEPLDPRISLKIKLGIARVAVPKPSCSWNSFSKAMSTNLNTVESGKLLSNMTASVEMGQSPLSFALNMQLGTQQNATITQANKLAERLSMNGFKDLTKPISGSTKTPAQMIQASTTTNVITSPNDAQKLRAESTLNKSGLLAAVGANALRVFTSSLASKLLDNYLKKGMVSGLDVVCNLSDGQAFDLCKGQIDENLAAGTSSGTSPASIATAYFASVFTPPTIVIDDYGPIGELSSCPGADNRGIWNCAMDQGFVSALNPDNGGYISVRDAVAKNYLHGNWQLLPKSNIKNGDFDCYTHSYCYTNLVKMRRMRVIPVGWEIAADSDANKNGGQITLKGAMDAFNDPNSPYYHLVDPDWVLKVPSTQCRNQAYGQTLAAANAGERAQVCVDAPSCIAEDADGKCTSGYGYCTREHSVWRIDAKTCPSQYATCQQFTNPTGKNLGVLTNTVDSSFCSAANAGCLPYSLAQTVSGAWSVQPQELAYFNSQVKECDAEAAGCRSLVQVKSVSTANLIPNPSLELTTADGSMASSWTKDWETAGPSQYLRDGVSAFDGLASYVVADKLSLGGWHNLGGTVDIAIQPNKQYTLSYYAKRGTGNSGQLAVKLFDRPFVGPFTDVCTAYVNTAPTCVQDLSTGAMAPTCSTTSSSPFATCRTGEGGDYGPTNPNGEIDVNFPLDPSYQRYSVTFASTENSHYIGLYFTAPQGTYYIDAVQLELGSTATAFHVGGSDKSGLAVNIKSPPSYLGCTGETNDPAACSAFAKVCRQSEVGCDAYKPVSGGTVVTAIAASGDACNVKCVGYNTFKQEKTIWESDATSTVRFPLYFIPSTAKACQLTDAGCDEFTNLEKVASGGEAKAYYTYIRACRKPDAANDGTFFGWEGSDASGYQLKSYNLRVRGDGSTAIFAVANTGDNYVRNSTGADNPNGPAYVAGTSVAGCTVAIYRSAATDPIHNPDCRELIDPDGNIFYRLLSRTVISVDNCVAFRKTVSNQADCGVSGGIWSSSGSCDYQTYVPGSTVCSAASVGCRAYTGNQGNNTQILATSTFENSNNNWTAGVVSNESTEVGGHSLYLDRTASSLSLVNASNASQLVKGRAYILTLWAKGQGNLDVLLRGNGVDRYLASATGSDGASGTLPTYALSTEWQRFVLGPVIADWTPGAGDVLTIRAGSNRQYFDNIQLIGTAGQFALIKGSWKTPAVCDQTSAGQALPQAQLGCAAYTNKAGLAVNLKSFDHLCRAQTVGCEAFTDTHGTDTPFTSYYNVQCTVGAGTTGDCKWHDGKNVCTVGSGTDHCTFNVVSSPKQIGTPYVSGGVTYSYWVDSAPVPADSTVYLINDGKSQCDAGAVGCTALGEMAVGKIMTTAGVTERIPFAPSGKTVYKIVDPADFGTNACASDAMGCDEWTAGNGQTSYFKNPGDALCEYKENVTVRGAKVSGWFKKGVSANEPCTPSIFQGGNYYGIAKNGDQDWAGFAGTCPTEAAACTEFTDPTDPGRAKVGTTTVTDCIYNFDQTTGASGWTRQSAPNTACNVQYKNGRPYYYIFGADLLDASTACNNTVSKKQGCVALNQTDKPSLNINALATYAASDAAGGKAIAPISDAGNTANIVLSVKRDRICSEWLECNTSQATTDPTTGRTASRCLSLGSCIEKDSQGNCKTWGRLESDTSLAAVGVDTQGATAYKARDISTSGNDYSGFSIPGLDSVDKFKQSNLNNVYTLSTNLQPLAQSCKVYPEADSPFPKDVLSDAMGPTNGPRKTSFNNVNVCETNTKDGSCECSYRKVTYSESFSTFYKPQAETGVKSDGTPGEIPAAICSGGTYDGLECNPIASGSRIDTTGNPNTNNLSCDGIKSGDCVPYKKVDSLIGQKGYCLESDASFKAAGGTQQACITWLPIDSVQGKDTANQFLSAAFIPKIGQERYCSAPAKYCVPHDCANPPQMLPVCTLLQNADIHYSGTSDYEGVITKNGTIYHTNGCFQTCANSNCFAQEQNKCMGIIDKFCGADEDGDYNGDVNSVYGMNAVPSSAPAGTTGCDIQVQRVQGCSIENLKIDPVTKAQSKEIVTNTTFYCQNLLAKCKAFMAPRLAFCDAMERAMVPNSSGVLVRTRTSSYGSQQNAATYVGSWCGSYNGSGKTGYVPYSDYDYHGRTTGMIPAANYDNYDKVHLNTPHRYYSSSAADSSKNISYFGAAYTLEDCSTSGTKEAWGDQTPGAPGACPSGLEAVEANSLSVAQTEYTQEESNEALTFDKDSLGVNLTQSNPLFYPTIPGWGLTRNTYDKFVPNTHTFFGSANNGPAQSTLPVLSSSVLKFHLAVDSADGDWLSVNTKDGCGADKTDPCYTLNFANADGVDSSRKIAPYPKDLIGYYRYGTGDSGTATVAYDLTEPKLILMSQIDSVSVKVLSRGNNGLCQYGASNHLRWREYGDTGLELPYNWGIETTNYTSENANFGYCLKQFKNVNTNQADLNTTSDHSYGYLIGGGYNSSDDENFSQYGITYVNLSKSNNWSGRLDSGEGMFQISLVFSEDNPKRLLGVKLSMTDKDSRGYLFISAFDVRLNGQMCGQATYIGSSNPQAETGIPVAYTNSVNAVKDHIGPGKMPGVSNFDNQCKPWGAFTITSPQSVVSGQGISGVCELNKGTIYADQASLRNLFAWGQPADFRSDVFGFERPTSTNPAFAPVGGTLPQVTGVVVNGSATPVAGVGSLKVDLNFYAAASADQMPIRSVVVDWGDGSSVVDPGKINYYKNHSASCVGDNFGASSGACDPNPFSYSHTYTCATGTCTFTPYITVTDNWGVATNQGNRIAAPNVKVCAPESQTCTP